MVKKAIETDQTRETSMHFFGQRFLVSWKKMEDSIILKSFHVIEWVSEGMDIFHIEISGTTKTLFNFNIDKLYFNFMHIKNDLERIAF